MRCLIDAIDTSNSNNQANAIHLEAGTYSLTDVNNTVDPGSEVGNGLPVILGTVTIVGVAAHTTIIERANFT